MKKLGVVLIFLGLFSLCCVNKTAAEETQSFIDCVNFIVDIDLGKPFFFSENEPDKNTLATLQKMDFSAGKLFPGIYVISWTVKANKLIVKLCDIYDVQLSENRAKSKIIYGNHRVSLEEMMCQQYIYWKRKIFSYSNVPGSADLDIYYQIFMGYKYYKLRIDFSRFNSKTNEVEYEINYLSR